MSWSISFVDVEYVNLTMTAQDQKDTAQTVTMWLGKDDQQMYRTLKDGLNVDDTISNECKKRIRDGLFVREAFRSLGKTFDSDQERREWVIEAIIEYEQQVGSDL